VIRFNVRHDGDVWRECQKGSVIFIRLDDEQLVRLVVQIPLPFGDASTGEPGRPQASARQHGGRHHRRRGLAVGASYPNDASARNCASERLGSSRYWDSQLTRMRKLGMIPRYCGCNDQLARTIDVVRAMSLDDTDSERRQIFSGARVGIASCNSNTASSD